MQINLIIMPNMLFLFCYLYVTGLSVAPVILSSYWHMSLLLCEESPEYLVKYIDNCDGVEGKNDFFLTNPSAQQVALNMLVKFTITIKTLLCISCWLQKKFKKKVFRQYIYSISSSSYFAYFMLKHRFVKKVVNTFLIPLNSNKNEKVFIRYRIFTKRARESIN